MPPSTAQDQWLSGRHFGVVIDAGSSGSRVQIYSWKDPKVIRLDKDIDSPDLLTLPTVEKGTRNGEDWVTKVEPGISTFADDSDDLPDTSLSTGNRGMRLLSPEQQAEILLKTCHFFMDSPSDAGPCGSSVRIITGEEEGLFGWIAVNYLMDGFAGSSNPTTYGFLDMGGASTQIAFEPNKAHQHDSKSLVDVSLRLLNGQEISHKVFVTTWLGYGTNQARERYVGQAINDFEEHPSNDDVVPDPCLPKDLELIETPVQSGSSSEHSRKSHRLVGTGSFEQCMRNTSSLLNKHTPCPDTPCLMNGVYVPPIDFSVSHFIGVSEYWYSSEHVFGLGGAYDYVQYERAASAFCSRNWSDIVAEHDASRQRPSGDGEVEENGKIVEVGQWGDQVEIPRLQMQCFKAAWIANVLHEGIGMPRIVDPGGNGTTHGDEVVEKAERKGLGRPTFQSVDTVGDIAISWTLGKMVVEASKEIPILDSGKPIGDPLDNIPDENFPIQPIRPPWVDMLEDKITPHLPSSLTRSSLGFSPVILLFWIMVFFIALLISYPLRRRLRANCLRSIRTMSKQRDFEIYNMEEGKPFANGSRPPSPTGKSFKWLRRIITTSHRPTPARMSPSLSIPSSPVTPSRISPTRSYSLPTGIIPSDDFYSRSQNASQLNLSSLAPRQGAISRINSMHYLHE
ncbi:hypothetical protein BDZ89DRAFT_1070593 [Hymenopellis radicata]|nr:hypothetical protein BDZ89DRAFT_1070593 [Hymenopellis radicata]